MCSSLTIKDAQICGEALNKASVEEEPPNNPISPENAVEAIYTTTNQAVCVGGGGLCLCCQTEL